MAGSDEKLMKYVPTVEMQWLGNTLSYGDEDLLFKFKQKALPPIIIRKSMLPREEKLGASRELIGAAVSACIVGWLIAGLKTFKIPIEDLTAVTDTEIGTDKKGRTVIESCTTKIKVKITEDGRDKKELERIKKIVERFMRTGCLITRSVERGFRFNCECNWLQKES